MMNLFSLHFAVVIIIIITSRLHTRIGVKEEDLQDEKFRGFFFPFLPTSFGNPSSAVVFPETYRSNGEQDQGDGEEHVLPGQRAASPKRTKEEGNADKCKKKKNRRDDHLPNQYR